MSQPSFVYKGAGERRAFMTHPVSLFGAVALGIVLATTWAEAQTVHHRAKHPVAGRQITVRKGVEPWLTLGTWAPVGSRQAYVLDTFRPMQRNSVQGTFVEMRGNDRLPNDIRLPEANRPLITVSAPGLSGPWLQLY
jgi:hypothetical protein